jgi:hypothetical protein
LFRNFLQNFISLVGSSPSGKPSWRFGHPPLFVKKMCVVATVSSMQRMDGAFQIQNSDCKLTEVAWISPLSPFIYYCTFRRIAYESRDCLWLHTLDQELHYLPPIQYKEKIWKRDE